MTDGRKRFGLILAAFLLIYAGYGLRRFTLGVDFTDEGAYIAWPLRTLFGERLFESELMTLIKPIGLFLSPLFALHPGLSLYEFRLLGWTVHLGAFAIFATYLFRRSGAPLTSPLIASVPFFSCHIFGLAAPSYNTLSSDFLLIAFSLRALAGLGGSERRTALHLAGGLALFVATVAHPALGVVAGVLLLRETIRHDLLTNTLRRRLTPSNAGALAFLGCWVALALYFVLHGDLADWMRRIPLARSFSGNSLQEHPLRFPAELLSHPFSHSGLAWAVTLAAAAILAGRHWLRRRGDSARAGDAAAGLAFVLGTAIVAAFSYDPEHLPVAFAQVCLILLAVMVLAPPVEAAIDPETRFLLLLAGLAAVLCATFTFYFSPLRSWISGSLALPFVFGTGLSGLLAGAAGRRNLPRLLAVAALGLAVLCVGREHYRFIQRDAIPAELVAEFQVPKFRHLRSTPERVAAVDALHAYLQPKLSRGEPLLAYDDCPMLYYLFDAKPAYGLTWAVRYTQSAATLRQLNEEFQARPLPRYAIRTLVDLSNPIWGIARRTRYDSYPLNATVMERYELEHTVFPFEIWRRKGDGLRP